MQSIGESTAMLVMAVLPQCCLAQITAQQHGLGHSEDTAMQNQSVATFPFLFWPHQLAIQFCAAHLNLKLFTHL